MQKISERPLPGWEARIVFIVTELLSKRELPTRVEADQPLYDTGLSSLDLVDLMLAVEAEFDLEIPQQEITPENFRSVTAIGRLVESLAVAA
jgi:acyl carrier protein